jgi:anti-sigma factor RsiW
VSHLGERVTALVDGQLSPEATERAHAHLAGCRPCRDLVEAERLMKARLASLDGPPPAPELLGRLLALGGPAGPLPPRAGHVPGTPRPAVLALPAAPARVGRPAVSRPAARPVAGRRGSVAPAGTGPGRRPRRRARLAVAVFGALTVVGVGVSGLALSSGGPEPTVVPPVDSFVVDHVRSTSQLPFVDVLAGWQGTTSAQGGGAGQ